VRSRPSARVIMASLLLLLVLYLFKDVINMSTSTSFIIASIIINIITLNIVTIHPQKNNWQAILQDFAFVTIFLTISFLIFSIFVLHGANLIDTESKATFTSIGSGLIAIFGFIFIYQRLEKQQKQIDIQIDQLTTGGR
jgi:signal transduction histidine kinase